MSFRQFFALVNFEARPVLTWMVLSLAYVALDFQFKRYGEYSYSLDEGSILTFSLTSLCPIIAAGFQLFPATRKLNDLSHSAGLPDTHEFLFTRAVSRRRIYAVKMTLFLLIALLPSLVALCRTLPAPDLRLKLDSDSRLAREHAQFYLSHFEGSKVVEDKVYGTQQPSEVWIPSGRIHVKVMGVLTALLVASLIHLFNVSFWRGKISGIIALLLLLAAYVSYMYVYGVKHHRGELSLTELFAGWGHQNLVLTVTGIMALTLWTHWFACRRFLATEVNG